MKTYRRAARLLTCGGACLLILATVGCYESEWVSRESAQGKELEKISLDKTTIVAQAPAGWPYQFDPVQVQKQYSDANGTRYRAVLPWRQTGSRAEVGQQFAGLLNDTSGRQIDYLLLRITYLDQDGRADDDEVVRLYPDQHTGTIILRDFGKRGSHRSVAVTLVQVIWVEPPVEPTETPTEDK